MDKRFFSFLRRHLWQKPMRILWGGLACVLLSMGLVRPPSDRYFDIIKNLDIFSTLYKQLYAYHVDNIAPSVLMKAAISAMLHQLDPYTVYIPEEDIESYRTMTTGTYGGVGASISWRDSTLVVTGLYKDAPALGAGMRIGDRIRLINGVSVAGKAETDLFHLLKGQVGTPLTLEVERIGEKYPLQLELVREKVTLKSVPYYGMLTAKVGYIRLSEFTTQASSAVEDAYAGLQKEGIRALVLDLRGNPGGLLNESVEIANFFIPRGVEVVRAQGRLQEWNRIYYADATPLDTLMRLGILVDGKSASASEIVSGVVQDYDRGVIIGQKTFGKGLVQTVIPLVYNAQLKVTTARYYTPSGRCIQSIHYSASDKGLDAASYDPSTQSLFRTKNGRPVYDRGGIEPDVVVSHTKERSDIVRALLDDFFIFDYATHYAAKHDSIAPPKAFQLTDADYLDFCTWLKAQPEPLKTESNWRIEALEQTLNRGSDTDWKTHTEHLKDWVAQATEQALRDEQKTIQRLLEAEIIKRYYFQEGVLKAAMAYDLDVQTAVKVLMDSVRYTALLRAAP